MSVARCLIVTIMVTCTGMPANRYIGGCHLLEGATSLKLVLKGYESAGRSKIVPPGQATRAIEVVLYICM